MSTSATRRLPALGLDADQAAAWPPGVELNIQPRGQVDGNGYTGFGAEAHHRATRLCRAFSMSRGGHFEWRDRSPCVRMLEDQRLVPLLWQLHQETHEGYGAVKLWRKAKCRGIQCGRHRVV